MALGFCLCHGRSIAVQELPLAHRLLHYVDLGARCCCGWARSGARSRNRDGNGIECLKRP
jgi:hypothetical protein